MVLPGCGKAKFMQDVDNDHEVQRDSFAWRVPRELPPWFTKLEDNLSGLKTLFKAKLGENVDYDNERERERESEQEVHKDGITCWCLAELPRRSRGVRITSPT